ncbi:MAG: DUF4252 domain-containing protein [Saprospiraceae bacterium]
MKKLIFSLACLCLLSIGSAQNSVNLFIDELKSDDSSIAFTFPGWLLRFGINQAIDDDIEYEKGYEDIVDGIKKLRILNTKNLKHKRLQNLSYAISNFKEKDGFEDYARIRDNGKNVIVLVKEDNMRIKNLLVMIEGDKDFLIFNMKTDMDLQQLKDAKLSFNKGRIKD